MLLQTIFLLALATLSLAQYGDSQCVKLMCIAVSLNATSGTATYTMTSNRNGNTGWIAMGWGKKMADTPMVIMWTNPDGTVTLSQRTASGHDMPTVQSNPDRIASIEMSQTLASKYAFTVPFNSAAINSKEDVIWALGTASPSSSAVDAKILQHLDADHFTLDLSKTISPSSPSATSPSSPSSSSASDPSESPPLETYQKLIVAHAILATLGFLFFLPLGVLIARYGRTRTGVWFKSHMYTQLLISGPIIVTAVALGIASVQVADSGHVNDDHKRWGIALTSFYFVQVALGFIIHHIKTRSGKRPIRNYMHVILGLVLIGLACYEVHSGFDDEWVKETGRDRIGKGVSVLWYIWCAVIAGLYLAGLMFLRTQFRQENESRLAKEGDSEMDDLTHLRQ